MSWLCDKCGTNNANANEQCVICFVNDSVIVPRPENIGFDDHDFDVNRCHIYFITEALHKYGTTWGISMTESEKLFANFFSEEKILVSSMNDLELRAHREELSKIAFEARARLTATDNEERERHAKNKTKRGLSVSLQTDDITSDAIHSINERQKKMSKQDKQIKAMVGLGMSQEDAENMFRASTLLALKRGELPGEKKKKKEDIAKITTNQCPECEHKYDVNDTGLMTCNS